VKKIIILGSSGMLGSCLVRSLREKYKVVGISRYRDDTTNYACDFKNLKDLEKILNKEKSDLIINSAALTNLNICEENSELASLIHYILPLFLSERHERNIHISTDSVFDGETGFYHEESSPNPLNIYAKTKLLGEAPILSNGGLVLRVNIYGFNSNLKRSSLFEWAYNAIKKNEAIVGYDDVIFNPVSIFRLAELMDYFASNETVGLLNVGANCAISKAEFIQHMIKIINPNYCNFTISNQPKSEVRRPKNTVLDTGKLIGMGLGEFDWKDDLRVAIKKIED
jgi:dTDP-4-dehydrorhamnose reductase